MPLGYYGAVDPFGVLSPNARKIRQNQLVQRSNQARPIMTPVQPQWQGIPYQPAQAAPMAPTGPSSFAPSASTSVAQTAADAAALEAARNDVRSRVGSAQGVYDALFGDVDQATASRRGELESGFEQELDAVAREQLRGTEAIGRTHAARGLTDSSYRINALEEAADEYENVLRNINEERQGKLGELGQYATTTKAGFQAGRDYLNTLVNSLGEVNDLNSLVSLRDSLDQRIADLGTQRSGLLTQSEFINRLNAISPATSRVPGMQERLTKIANSPAPEGEKARIARGFISSSGLSEEEKRNLLDYYNRLSTAPAAPAAPVVG